VQVLALDLLDSAERGVEVVSDGEMAAGQMVAAAAGEPEDQPGGLIGVGAVPGCAV
jgi:hypothetical protein